MSEDDRSAVAAGTGRLFTVLTWAVLLLGLWLWGREVSDGQSLAAPVNGDVATAGRPATHPLPPARAPLSDIAPSRIDIVTAGVKSAQIVERGLDRDGAVDPPSFKTPQAVGWYGGGPSPGAPGAALLVGHVDTESRPAVFYGLSNVKAGERVRVTRADDSVAEFTIESVEIFSRRGFDAQRVYGPHQPGRAELRLITCGGRYDREAHAYDANVVVSAYLTGTGPAAR